MSKGKDRGSSQQKKPAQKTIKDKRKEKREKKADNGRTEP
jgi:hypothetical protein